MTKENLLKEIVNYLKNELKDNLISVVLFGSFLRKEEPEDIDILVIVNEYPDKELYFGKCSFLVLSKKDFVKNCVEATPLIKGIVLTGYKILYDPYSFFSKWIVATINRIKKEDLVYKEGYIYKL